MADKPVCQQSIAWLKHHFGSTHLAPLTGQDRRALLAFVHLLELYAVADGPGQKAATLAMEATLHAMQPKTRPFARDAIPSVLDESSDLWSLLTAEDPRIRRIVCGECGGEEACQACNRCTECGDRRHRHPKENIDP